MLSVVSDIHGGSWNVSPADKEGDYCLLLKWLTATQVAQFWRVGEFCWTETITRGVLTSLRPRVLNFCCILEAPGSFKIMPPETGVISAGYKRHVGTFKSSLSDFIEQSKLRTTIQLFPGVLPPVKWLLFDLTFKADLSKLSFFICLYSKHSTEIL